MKSTRRPGAAAMRSTPRSTSLLKKKRKEKIEKTRISYLLECTSASRPDALKMALDALALGSRANGSRQVWTRDETRQMWTRDDRHRSYSLQTTDTAHALHHNPEPHRSQAPIYLHTHAHTCICICIYIYRRTRTHAMRENVGNMSIYAITRREAAHGGHVCHYMLHIRELRRG